jgi:hypothetical protein
MVIMAVGLGVGCGAGVSPAALFRMDGGGQDARATIKAGLSCRHSARFHKSRG